ncbi:MAG: type II secretion system protein M [Nitrososphaera sp.]|nr:type II secretion system protein M [Nitrososphaera sp.]
MMVKEKVREDRALNWVPIVAAMAVGAAVMGVVAWHFNVKSLDEQIERTRASMKTLSLGGGIPPSLEVTDHLNARKEVFEKRYAYWLGRIAESPPLEATQADSQLHIQEKFHEVQQTLERMAAARTIPIPEVLGFPKEIPPSDAAPRLLMQLKLLEETARLILEQEISSLSSLKLEDPEAIPEQGGQRALLIRLPVRIRMTSSLAQLVRVLGALEKASPLIDVHNLNISRHSNDLLEVELVLARYLSGESDEQMDEVEGDDEEPTAG